MLWSWYAELLFWLHFHCRSCSIYIYYYFFKWQMLFISMLNLVDFVLARSGALPSLCTLPVLCLGGVSASFLRTFGYRNSNGALVYFGWPRAWSGSWSGKSCFCVKKTSCRDAPRWSLVHHSTEPHWKHCRYLHRFKHWCVEFCLAMLGSLGKICLQR